MTRNVCVCTVRTLFVYMVATFRVAPLSLRDFIWRSKVLTQFRAFLRALRALDDVSARDARLKVRAGFESARGASRDVRVTLLADGETQLAVLRKTAALAERANAAACGTSGHVHGASCGSSSNGKSNIGMKADAGDSIQQHRIVRAATLNVEDTKIINAGGRAAIGAPTIDTSDKKGSWVGTGPRDDERGRVGSGWPWG